MMRKGLAVAVIILFIGLAFAPSINAVDDPVPDLDCNGSLSWTDVIPGATLTGEFCIENIGEQTSSLSWEISKYPSEWGYWTFNPESGENLHPEDGNLTINAIVIAPEDINSKFDGEIIIINTFDSNDSCSITVSLATQKYQTFLFPDLIKNRFPLLYQIFILKVFRTISKCVSDTETTI